MQTTTVPSVPTTSPVQVADETFLIPNLAPAGPGAYVPVNSLLIRGDQPIIVDTGAPIHREHWLEMVFSLVDPSDVRWVFLSHDDGDHTGSLHDVLAACPDATLVTNFFSVERLNVERPLDLRRMIWREPAETFRRRRPAPAPVPPPGVRRPYDPGALRRADRSDVVRRLVRGADHRRRASTRGAAPGPIRRELRHVQLAGLTLARVARPGDVQPPRRHRRGPRALVVGGNTLAGAQPPAHQAPLADVRRATARYHDPAIAEANGYIATESCAEHPHLGGMGYHYVNPSLVADPAVDPAHPEVLLYERRHDGRRRLVAVEWLVVDPDQDSSTDAGRLTLFDVAFDGPMEGHDEGMPVHFDLHAWVWKHNPSGMFDAWNPLVACDP